MIGIRLTGKKGQVVAAFMVGLDDEIVAVSSGGVAIRMGVRDISSQGRDATGVRVMNVDDGQSRRLRRPDHRQRRRVAVASIEPRLRIGVSAQSSDH